MLISNFELKIINFDLAVLSRGQTGAWVGVHCGSKPGDVTFVATAATQSFQWCHLENVAELSYVAVTKCQLLSKFSKF